MGKNAMWNRSTGSTVGRAGSPAINLIKVKEVTASAVRTLALAAVVALSAIAVGCGGDTNYVLPSNGAIAGNAGNTGKAPIKKTSILYAGTGDFTNCALLGLVTGVNVLPPGELVTAAGDQLAVRAPIGEIFTITVSRYVYRTSGKYLVDQTADVVISPNGTIPTVAWACTDGQLQAGDPSVSAGGCGICTDPGACPAAEPANCDPAGNAGASGSTGAAGMTGNPDPSGPTDPTDPGNGTSGGNNGGSNNPPAPVCLPVPVSVQTFFSMGSPCATATANGTPNPPVIRIGGTQAEDSCGALVLFAPGDLPNGSLLYIDIRTDGSGYITFRQSGGITQRRAIDPGVVGMIVQLSAPPGSPTVLEIGLGGLPEGATVSIGTSAATIDVCPPTTKYTPNSTDNNSETATDITVLHREFRNRALGLLLKVDVNLATYQSGITCVPDHSPWWVAGITGELDAERTVGNRTIVAKLADGRAVFFTRGTTWSNRQMCAAVASNRACVTRCSPTLRTMGAAAAGAFASFLAASRVAAVWAAAELEPVMVTAAAAL